jgi:hypothetical protein
MGWRRDFAIFGLKLRVLLRRVRLAERAAVGELESAVATHEYRH